MGGDGILDAFGNAKLVFGLIEAHGAATDRIDRRHDLFAWIEVSVVNSLRALQRAVWPANRRDDGWEATDELTVAIEVGAAGIAFEHVGQVVFGASAPPKIVGNY